MTQYSDFWKEPPSQVVGKNLVNFGVEVRNEGSQEYYWVLDQ